MVALPTGTVTLMFADIAGSTRLLARLGAERYAEALGNYRATLRAAVAEHGGAEVDTEGDGMFAAFPTARAGLDAATSVQVALADRQTRPRIGVHTGDPVLTSTGYVGLDVHRAARICAAGHGGQTVVSPTTAALCPGAALRNLGRHRLKDLDEPVRLFQLGEDDFPPLRTLTATDLPISVSELFGRDADIAQVAALVREPDTRLLTLLGPGGVGKTRLAVAAARSAADSFGDGARYVDLAPLTAHVEIGPAIAGALGARLRPDEPIVPVLADSLADRELLLVLDNFEHVLGGAPLVADILASSSGVTVLATSREPLRVMAERIHPVRPLDLPRDATEPAAHAKRHAAVALFVDRVRRQHPEFLLDDGTSSHVSAICQRLDGLPLAIELAAARVGLLAPAELAARIDDALAVLIGRARDVPERHRTLRATLEWSHALLDDEERRAFAFMGAFASGAAASDAEAVTRASLETLESLVDKQLLVRRGDRLTMLETIRAFARERLETDHRANVARRRHAEHYLKITSSVSPAAVGRGAETRMILDHLDELRAAVSWSSVHARQLHLELLIALAGLWWIPTVRVETAAWIDVAVRRDLATSPPDLAGRLLLARAMGIDRTHPERLASARTALTRLQDLGDKVGTVRALCLVSDAESMRMNLGVAAGVAARAHELARECQDDLLIGTALFSRALASATYSELVPFAREGQRHLERAGALGIVVMVLSTASWVACETDAFAEAEALLVEAHEIARSIDDVHGTTIVLGCKGTAALLQHRWDEAEAAFQEQLSLAAGSNWHDAEYWEPLHGLAIVAAVRGEAERAAFLESAATRRGRQAVDAEAPIYERIDHTLDAARGTVDDATWMRAAQAGAHASPAELRRAALEVPALTTPRS